MASHNMSERVAELISTHRRNASEPLESELSALESRLAEPVRVAVVGRVKAGKSTLVNALLGQSVAPTDVSECTKLVTWFRYGHPQRVVAELEGGGVREVQLTSEGRLPAELGTGDATVAAVQVYLANDTLRSMTLIDTPGIGSVHDDLSSSTRELLSASRDTSAAAAKADAVVLLLSQAVMEDDLEALALFQAADTGGRRATASNVVGVLSRADQLGDGSVDSWELAAELAAGYAQRLRSQMATVVPLMGLLAETAETAALTELDARQLAALAAMDPDEFERLLWSADRFGSAEASVTTESREHLLALLDLYGVRRVTGLVRARAQRRKCSAPRGLEGVGYRDREADDSRPVPGTGHPSQGSVGARAAPRPDLRPHGRRARRRPVAGAADRRRGVEVGAGHASHRRDGGRLRLRSRARGASVHDAGGGDSPVRFRHLGRAHWRRRGGQGPAGPQCRGGYEALALPAGDLRLPGGGSCRPRRPPHVPAGVAGELVTAPEGGPPDGVGPWQLSIDLGTSRTRGAVSDRQSASLLELGSDGQRWMPSCVFRAEDGQILVGDPARRLAALLPERFEPQARRLLGAAELFLGDGPVAVSDLVAAVLKHVLETASRGNGGVAPSRVLLTYPAQWGEGRKRALLDAAEAAGIHEADLVTEVEAAAQPGLVETEAGLYVAVCDLGGARCEASVLLRTGEGFTLAGPPADRDPLGGDDIDERILSYFGQLFESERPDEWHALSAPADPRSRRQAQELRDEVRRAKEALGGSEACELSIPGISSEVQLTRHELEPLTADFAEAAVDLLQRALDQSSVTAGELERLYLVGGSAALPQVQDAIWRRLQLRPLVAPDPGGAVAIGACTSVGVRRRPSARPAGGSLGPARGTVADSPASPPPPPPSQARPDDGTLAYTPALAMALDAAD